MPNNPQVETRNAILTRVLNAIIIRANLRNWFTYFWAPAFVQKTNEHQITKTEKACNLRTVVGFPQALSSFYQNNIGRPRISEIFNIKNTTQILYQPSIAKEL